MRFKKWRLILALSLVGLSAALYLVHFFIFRDAHHIFIYLLGDIAFTPIEVLIVTLIIHRVLSDREKMVMLKKLNMVIGAFFSEVGLKLIYISAEFDIKSGYLMDKLSNISNWEEKDFIEASRNIDEYKFKIDSKQGDLAQLKDFLTKRRNFLLRLLENPNLLEHEKFTELLWAVFHLTEELEFRDNLNNLPESDCEHISGDISRVYTLLTSGWVDYIKHLKERYPYLYSLAARINPFDKEATPIVK